MNRFPLSNRTLGTIGLINAPFLLLGMVLMERYPELKKTAFDGLNSLFFMLSWMGSLVGLIRLKATGSSAFGRWILRINLATLALANLWNIYNAIQPEANTPLFWFLDAFWPISMLTMLLVGLTVAYVGIFNGWQRYVPLAVGLWIPFTALVGKSLGAILPVIAPSSVSQAMLYTLITSGAYAMVCWGLLAYIVRTTPPSAQPINNRFVVR